MGGIRTHVACRFRQFEADESGTIIPWFLFTIVSMMLAVGLGLSLLLHEMNRISMQNTLDRAVLAATDLDQTRDAVKVIKDYAERAGIGETLTDVEVTQGVNYRRSTASAEVDVQTIFVPNSPVWKVETTAAAFESITDVEIALVLDNSGSMGWDQGATSGDGNYRLNLLKPAAKDFIDAVSRPVIAGMPGSVAISIVPFSTQVNAGPLLSRHLDFTSQHDYSACARFGDADFETTALPQDETIQRAGHFDIFTWDSPVTTEGVVCPFDGSRHITLWSQDRTRLKAQIDAMWAGGNTSIDVATKWGAATLDPTFRPVLDALVSEGEVQSNLTGQPFDHGREDTLKVLVVMSDGQNTSEFRLRDEYRSGDSPVFRDPDTGDLSYRYRYYGTTYFYSLDDRRWRHEPDGGDDAVRLTWPELLDSMSVRNYAYYVKAQALGGNWTNYYYEMYEAVPAWRKNQRTSEICKAARDAGIVVYTIGMDTYGQGDDTLEDCAGSSTHFYDIDAIEIGQAFSSIAQQINQLRLTH
jgi:Flp pilus assembly protein TadG